MTGRPSLKPLHGAAGLSAAKLAMLERMDSDSLKRTLASGQEHCLKTRPDGTMLDGHHRVYVLRSRGEDVDELAREVIAGVGES